MQASELWIAGGGPGGSSRRQLAEGGGTTTLIESGGGGEIRIEQGAPPVHLEDLTLLLPVHARGARLTARRSSFGGGEGGPALRVSSAGEASLSQCSFVNNTGDDGGALAVNGTVRLHSSHFEGNTANRGGGLFLHAGVVFLTNVSCAHNEALLDGGFAYIDDGHLYLGERSELYDNRVSSLDGAAVFVRANRAAISYILPAPLGRWITGTLECQADAACRELLALFPSALLPNSTVSTVSRIDGVYPHRCRPGVFGASSSPSFQQSSDCESACPAGYHCPEGTIVPLACSPGFYCPLSSGHALECPAGTYSRDSLLQSVTQCEQCPEGSFCPEATSEPIQCYKASYNDLPGRQASTDCIPCPEFATTVTMGSSHNGSCVCDVGYYDVSRGLPDCKRCPTNTICNRTGIPIEGLLLSPGYYRKVRTSEDIRACPDTRKGALSGCTGLPEQPCSAGLSGVYCTSCIVRNNTPMYFVASQSSCEECPPVMSMVVNYILFLLFGLILLFAILSWMVWTCLRLLRRQPVEVHRPRSAPVRRNTTMGCSSKQVVLHSARQAAGLTSRKLLSAVTRSGSLASARMRTFSRKHSWLRTIPDDAKVLW